MAAKILDEGSPRDLIDRHVKGHVFEVQKPVPEDFLKQSWDREDVGDAWLVYTDDATAFANAAPPDAVYLHRQANLEDVFLRLTGRALREP